MIGKVVLEQALKHPDDVFTGADIIDEHPRKTEGRSTMWRRQHE